MLEKIKFVLSSTRFWAIIAIAVIGYISNEGLISESVATALVTILGGYAIVKTSQDFQYPEE